MASPTARKLSEFRTFLADYEKSEKEALNKKQGALLAKYRKTIVEYEKAKNKKELARINNSLIKLQREILKNKEASLERALAKVDALSMARQSASFPSRRPPKTRVDVELDKWKKELEHMTPAQQEELLKRMALKEDDRQGWKPVSPRRRTPAASGGPLGRIYSQEAKLLAPASDLMVYPDFYAAKQKRKRKRKTKGKKTKKHRKKTRKTRGIRRTRQ
jgi:hypothetical protein